MPDTPTPTVLVYARASSDPDDQRISVDRQLDLCADKARQEWPDAHVLSFRDDNRSASKPGVHRPGYEGFLAAVRAARPGEIVGVVVNEQSRLTRQTSQWEELVVALTRAGVEQITTLRAGPVSVGEGSRLIGRILALVDADEAERTRARVRAAHRSLFEEGRPTGAPPFGFKAVREAPDGGKARTRWVHDEAQAAAVRAMFTWVLDGLAIQVIADKLNAEGIAPRTATWNFRKRPRRTAPQWTYTGVRSVLRTPAVAGLRAHTDADGVVQTVPATQWDAIVPLDQWQKVQRLLGQPRTVTGANGQTYRVATKPAPTPRRYLLSGGSRNDGAGGREVYGVLRCGKCGLPLAAQTQQRRNGGRVPAYQCHPKVSPGACGGVSISPADDVEEHVVVALQNELRRSPKLRARLSAHQDAETARLRAERDDAKATMLDASRLRGTGDLDADSWEQMYRPARQRHDRAEAALAGLAAGEVDLPAVDDVLDGWEDLTLRQRRAVVDRLVESIVVEPARGGGVGFNAGRLGTPQWRR